MPLRIVPPDHAQYQAIRAAFKIAVRDLEERRNVDVTVKMKEEVVLAILDLASANQSDPEALARYAVSRALRLVSQ